LISANGERIGQGREAARLFLKEHPEKVAELEEKVMDHFGLKRKEEE
jgi:recombination protein RecA